MNENHYAIILKSYLPYKRKIAILDRIEGRLDGITDSEKVSAGSLIEYASSTKAANGLHFLHHVELLAMPYGMAKTDILFLHHVLEICYFSIPVGSYEPEIFTMLLLIIKQNFLHACRVKKSSF